VNSTHWSGPGSTFDRAIGERSPKWWGWAPSVVAEGLLPLRDPLVGILDPGPPAPPEAVARALAQSLAPPRASDRAPAWLDAAQADAFRILLHTVRSHGAALCADPVGSGKTWLALAVAQAISHEPPVCFVPAPLVPQWEATARRLEVPIVAWSHSRLSLGRLPTVSPPFVIVDESHHFRRPSIRRYRTLAPWLVGRRVLLLSATPVVNNSQDLYHQLHLALRDDVLADAGQASMRNAFDRDTVPRALGRFAIQRVGTSVGPPRRERVEMVDSGAADLLPAIDVLALSSSADIAALVRTGLVQAAASSAAALLAALRRYRSLLRHAQDAAATGAIPNRRELRRLVGDASAQLVLWSLLDLTQEGYGELRVDDLPAVEALISEARRMADAPDAKAARLGEILRDQVPTLVFVTARESLAYLRHQLPDRWLAWCSGQRAGIGGTALSRRDVLSWFRPAPPVMRDQPGVPRTLLTTDVSAEGLDLQEAGRVVHYDLPWTEVRLEQRNGRAVRLGSHRAEVEIVRFLPGAEFERRIHQQGVLTRKAGLPSRHGLGPMVRHRWRWRREVAEAMPGPALTGHSAVEADIDGALAGIALERDGDPVASEVLWREGADNWTDEPAIVEARLLQAARSAAASLPTSAELRELLGSLCAPVRERLRDASARHVGDPSPRPTVLRVTGRLRALAARAARQRDGARLALLERTLAFCTAGHTAGEALLLDSLMTLDDEALLDRLPLLPEPPARLSALRPRMTGLIVFRRR